MRVLYVSHTARIAGAEHSLLVLLGSLPAGVSPVLACPRGELAAAAGRLGIEVRPIPGTDLSGRLHPRHTPRETVRLAASAGAVAAIAQVTAADVIHANTPRAGLICAAAGGAGSAGPVVHVRDAMPPGRVPGLTLHALARRASAFVCTSRFLAEQLPARVPRAIVANAVEPDRFDPAAVSRAHARARLGLREDEPVLAVVAQISPHKGQRDAIEALHLARSAHPRTRLLLVGSVKFASASTRYDNVGYRGELESLTAALGLGGAVSFLGERADVPDVLAAVDILLVPSWYEPFGRVAAEAMMMRVPVIATSVGGAREVIADGVDGLVLAPRDPGAWARAITSLLDDPDRRREMGALGRRRACEEFSPARHAERMLAVYEQARATTRVTRQTLVSSYALQSSGSGARPHG